MGEKKETALEPIAERISVDTFGGRVHVEWDPAAAVTPLGQLAFFVEFLKVSGVFDAWVDSCPLDYTSPNAPSKRDILGTFLLSILAGQNRYAHITSIRGDGVNPGLLGMKKVVSEDAARRSLDHIDEAQGTAWMEDHLRRCTEPLLDTPWILDADATIKTLYGKQEGAVVGYNPHKPGRPSHSYHSFFMSNTRLALSVDVQPGNRTAAKYSAPGLWAFIEKTPKNRWPKIIRGDAAYGVDPIMSQAESLGILYLFKLRLTTNVRRLIEKTFQNTDWVDAGQGWEGVEDRLQLTGWEKSRRVVVLRRELRGEIVLNTKDNRQIDLSFVEADAPFKRYEYAVLVTSLGDEILAVAQCYRDRADAENNFDELKNQWGWAGFTTQDLKRCRLSAGMVALIYNWWSLFVRLANPNKHHEAITSRPLLLNAVAKQTRHSGQTTVTITSTHAKIAQIQVILARLSAFLRSLKESAEQLTTAQRWAAILRHAFRKFMANYAPKPALAAFSSA